MCRRTIADTRDGVHKFPVVWGLYACCSYVRSDFHLRVFFCCWKQFFIFGTAGKLTSAAPIIVGPPLDPSIPHSAVILRSFRWVPNWSQMMPRDASLSDRYTPDRWCFSSLPRNIPRPKRVIKRSGRKQNIKWIILHAKQSFLNLAKSNQFFTVISIFRLT